MQGVELACSRDDSPINSAITIDKVRDFLHQVLLRDESVLRQIAQAPEDTRLVDNEFVFTLRGLHRMLDPQQQVPFKDFRKLLYDSTLNHELGLLGAEVVIYDSTGKTDSSLYCLKLR